jgi:hypothetical protein
MGFFTDETGWAEIARTLGVAKPFAKRLKALIDSLPPPCGRCGAETRNAYLLRPADADNRFGRPSRKSTCLVALQRLCQSCIDDLGGKEGVEAYFAERTAHGNSIRLKEGEGP